MSFRKTISNVHRYWVLVILWLCASCVLIAIPFAMRTVRDVRDLRNPDLIAVTQADVLAIRQFRGLQAQYAFTVNSQVYTFADETGRANLWAHISRSDWNAIQAGRGSLQVKYLVADPNVNQPVSTSSVSNDLVGAYCGVFLSIGLALLWGLGGVRLWRFLNGGDQKIRGGKSQVEAG
jgi:hypothetical protein